MSAVCHVIVTGVNGRLAGVIAGEVSEASPHNVSGIVAGELSILW
jgi:hypothetical protein